jgi:hypothetical protein
MATKKVQAWTIPGDSGGGLSVVYTGSGAAITVPPFGTEPPIGTLPLQAQFRVKYLQKKLLNHKETL